MKLNAKGIALIKQFEGLRLRAYQCSADVWTIGYGSTFYENGSRVKMGDVITRNRADALFLITVKNFERDVKSLLKQTLNENQFSALVSFAFNVGSDIDADTKAEGLGDSTLLRLVNQNPNNPAIRNEFMKWISRGTPSERGLTRRRQAEANLYFSPVN